MKIKTYRANNMKDILQQIRSELGSDAVILNTKDISGEHPCVEAVAAVDTRVSVPHSEAVRSDHPATSSHMVQKSDTHLSGIQKQLDQMRDLMCRIDRNMTQKEASKLQGMKDHLILCGIQPDLVQMLLEGIRESIRESCWEDRSLLKHHLVGHIQRLIRIAPPLQVQHGQTKFICLVGTTGVGKTTTLAKLASNYTLSQTRKVVLLSIDTYRIGAIDQLKLYGDLLDIPVVRIGNKEEMRDALSELSGQDLVLIDTIGYSQYNTTEIKAMKEILDVVPQLECLLTLAMNTDPYEVNRILKQFEIFSPRKLIFTKLDEACRFGPLLNAVMVPHKEVAYITFGQKVPEDIDIPRAGELAHYIIGDIHDRSSRNAAPLASRECASFWK